MKLDSLHIFTKLLHQHTQLLSSSGWGAGTWWGTQCPHVLPSVFQVDPRDPQSLHVSHSGWQRGRWRLVRLAISRQLDLRQCEAFVWIFPLLLVNAQLFILFDLPLFFLFSLFFLFLND